MTRLLPILLLLMTAFYVLPVKEVIKPCANICMADLDDLKEETSKKEKVKELFPFIYSFHVFSDPYTTVHHQQESRLPVSIHQVETPPPNKA